MPAGFVRVRAGDAFAALVLVALALVAQVLVSCGGASPATRPTATFEFGPALSGDLYLPDTADRAPLVVMVPGGGWRTADPTGLADLAAALAAAGVATAPVHLHAADDGVVYPEPVEEVLCAVAAAAEQMRNRGVDPGPVVVLGHSSGAHLAALAVLAPGRYTSTCGAPAVVPDALIGLSGPYDISKVPEAASALMGSDPADDPDAWAEANPVEQAALRPGVPVLLLHGSADDIVAVAFTTQFGEALRNAGHPTTVEVVPGADHRAIYRADVSSGPIAHWLSALPSQAVRPAATPRASRRPSPRR